MERHPLIEENLIINWVSASGRRLPLTIMLRRPPLCTFRSLVNGSQAFVFSKGDIEIGILGDRDRHTAVAEKIVVSCRQRPL